MRNTENNIITAYPDSYMEADVTTEATPAASAKDVTYPPYLLKSVYLPFKPVEESWTEFEQRIVLNKNKSNSTR